jgi:hypothetical protein
MNVKAVSGSRCDIFKSSNPAFLWKKEESNKDAVSVVGVSIDF